MLKFEELYIGLEIYDNKRKQLGKITHVGDVLVSIKYHKGYYSGITCNWSLYCQHIEKIKYQSPMEQLEDNLKKHYGIKILVDLIDI